MGTSKLVISVMGAKFWVRFKVNVLGSFSIAVEYKSLKSSLRWRLCRVVFDKEGGSVHKPHMHAWYYGIAWLKSQFNTYAFLPGRTHTDGTYTQFRSLSNSLFARADRLHIPPTLACAFSYRR